jgi:hypothetical protein
VLTCRVDVVVVKEGEKAILETAAIEEKETLSNVTLRRYFVSRQNVEIIEFCSSQLSKLIALVDTCEARYHGKAN